MTPVARKCLQRGLIVLPLLASCGRHPHLIDTLGSPTDQSGVLMEPDLRRVAPLVVVASVSENEVIERGKPSFRVPEVWLDLHRVRARIESVLRDNTHLTPGPELTFFYFTQALDSPKQNQVYPRLFAAVPGARYIFFLAVENGLLRSIGDVGDYSIRVLSGAHVGYKPPSDLGFAVADILLIKGDGTDLEEFAMSLRAAAKVAERWSSSLHTIELLRALSLHAKPIRNSACHVLVTYFKGQYSCLDLIKDDISEPEEVRAEALDVLTKERARDAEILKTLSDPASLFYRDRGDAEDVISLLNDPNPNVQRAACDVLRRYFPKDSAACSHI